MITPHFLGARVREQWNVRNRLLVSKLISLCALYDAIQYKHLPKCFAMFNGQRKRELMSSLQLGGVLGVNPSYSSPLKYQNILKL